MYQRVGAVAYKKDLGNTIALCEALDNPQNAYKSIHVAGTNGKGSSAHMLASVLQSAGYKTGLYTSPHLKSFTERIRINGVEISEQQVVEFVQKIQPLITELAPSFFEITVAMAFYLFAQEKVDIAVIEVGLGGRLDSTNIITPEVSLITNIDFDHEQMLGNTLELIAIEKAGIIKHKVPVVIGRRQPELESIFTEKAEKMGAPISFAGDQFAVEQANSERINVIHNDKIYLEGLKMDLKGDYQKENLPGVLEVLSLLKNSHFKYSEAEIIAGLEHVIQNTGLKGRWQILDKEPLVVCDTGHNEAGINSIVTQINSLAYDQLYMIWGAVNDKSLDKVLQQMPTEANYIFCQAQIPRAMDAHELSEKADKYGLYGEVIPDVNRALQAARAAAKKKDMIFIGGSTFVVAELDEL